jgi:hypothetical protein
MREASGETRASMVGLDFWPFERVSFVLLKIVAVGLPHQTCATARVAPVPVGNQIRTY